MLKRVASLMFSLLCMLFLLGLSWKPITANANSGGTLPVRLPSLTPVREATPESIAIPYPVPEEQVDQESDPVIAYPEPASEISSPLVIKPLTVKVRVRTYSWK